MLLFPAANDLLTMFVALEVLSLPLYLLCGLARRRRLLSQEAAMKYFLLGAFSSAFFLFGIAMLYGYSGSVRPGGDRRRRRPQRRQLDAAVRRHRAARHRPAVQDRRGAVPELEAGRLPGRADPGDRADGLLHAWSSAFGALLRVFYVAFGHLTWDWRPAMWVVAILTMVVGAIIAITQTDVKRLLAYSSIAHAGFVLTGVVAVDTRPGLSSTLFYLAAYGFTTVGRVRGGHPGARRGRRGRAPVPVGRAWAAGRRWWPASSRFSCSPSRASR